MFGRLRGLFARGSVDVPVDALIDQAERHLGAGNFEAAIRCLRDAVTVDPLDPRPLLPLAVALRDTGAADEAVGVLERLLTFEPESVDAHFVLGLLQQQRGVLAEAAVHFRAVVAHSPHLADGYVQLCQVQVASGAFAAARETITQGLIQVPEHALMQFLLANLHLQAADFVAADASYGRALELQPDWPEALYNRALAAGGAGRPEDASHHLSAALRLRPDYPAAALARGQLHRLAGRHEEAIADYGRVLAADPHASDALFGRATERLRLGRAEEALEDLDRLLAREPARTDAWMNRGSALLGLGRFTQALEAIDRALALEPVSAAALLMRARVLRDLERRGEALDAGRQVATAEADAPLLNDTGLLLRNLGDRQAALAALERALALQPDFAAALANRGLVLQELHRPDEALRDIDAALRVDPGLADAHANRGNVLQELERHHEALQAYARAFAIEPNLEDAYFNESLSRLILGDLSGGWPRYEWRWRGSGVPHAAAQFPQPMWDGRQALEGKTIYLYAEQGLGDTIQFCRYAKPLAERGATVLLRVQPPLVPLLQGLDGVARLVAADESPPRFDYHCPLLSLPLALDTTLQTIPAGGAYIRPAGPHFAERFEAWQARLGLHKDKPRIGLVWSGNVHHKNDRNRSIPLQEFARMVSVRARFVALQTEIREADAAVLKARGDIAWFGAELVDFAETAALVAQLDLVISVDTSVAHLAAAMGKPVWLLLPLNPDWRWLLGREDSPWYETMRLFRQARRGEWRDVIARVEQEIVQRFA